MASAVGQHRNEVRELVTMATYKHTTSESHLLQPSRALVIVKVYSKQGSDTDKAIITTAEGYLKGERDKQFR